MAKTGATRAEEQWLVGGVIFCSLFIRWASASRSLAGALTAIAAGSGVFGLYLAAKAFARAVRRKQS